MQLVKAFPEGSLLPFCFSVPRDRMTTSRVHQLYRRPSRDCTSLKILLLLFLLLNLFAAVLSLLCPIPFPIPAPPFPLLSDVLLALIVSMPTPSSNSPHIAPQLTPVDAISSRTTCPPERETNIWREREHAASSIEQDTDEETTPTLTSFTHAPLSPFGDHAVPLGESSAAPSGQPAATKDSTVVDDDDTTTMDSMSPAASVSTEGKDELGVSPSGTSPTSTSLPVPSTTSMNHEFSNVRVRTLDRPLQKLISC